MKSGKYKDLNAVIQEAISLFDKKQAEDILEAELQKGIDSGIDQNFDYQEWLNEVKQRFK